MQKNNESERLQQKYNFQIKQRTYSHNFKQMASDTVMCKESNSYRAACGA